MSGLFDRLCSSGALSVNGESPDYTGTCPACKQPTLVAVVIGDGKPPPIHCTSGCQPAQIAAALPPEAPRSSWTPIELAAIVSGIEAGEIVGAVPSLLRRDDGAALIYPGEVHSIAGEPESGKGWIMLAESARLIEAGERVLYLDFEDSAPNIVGRLLALGASGPAIVANFIYVKPEDALPSGALPKLLAAGPYGLAVIDGLSEAYALLGLDYGSNTDVPLFLQRLVRPIAATGAPVVQIDHVAKDKNNRGRFAIGAQHKLAGVACAYSVETIERPSRAQIGRVKLVLAKDRHGHIAGQVGSTIAIATITPHDAGARVSVTLGPPDATGDGGTFRPTKLMERVSRAIEGHAGLSRNAIQRTVKGKAQYVGTALELLVADGFVHAKRDGQTHRHYSVRPYRFPDSQPVPNRLPGMGTRDRFPGSPPTGGPEPGTGNEPGNRTATASRSEDAELDRAEALAERNADMGSGAA